MPLPEGFEPIETKGVQKRQKTDTVIITKSGDIYTSVESYAIDVE